MSVPRSAVFVPGPLDQADADKHRLLATLQRCPCANVADLAVMSYRRRWSRLYVRRMLDALEAAGFVEPRWVARPLDSSGGGF